MSNTTSTWIIRACLMCSALLVILTFAYSKAKANSSSTRDLPTVVETDNTVAEVANPEPEVPAKPYQAQSFAARAAAAATVGAAVGSSGYAEALKRRAWLDPVEMPKYPMEVKYTVPEKASISKIASMWGFPSSQLLAMNPGFTAEDVVEAQVELTVIKRYASTPEPKSVGATNRGRILNSWLLPEGDQNSGYFLRDFRPNTFATANAIAAIRGGLKAYADKYPGAQRINIGDFSRRRGGKLKPHSSHTSGRDVDIGFVHTTDIGEQQRFTRASWTNLDAEKTWYSLKSIIATGEVKTIYLDISVQKMLYPVAQKELNEQQLNAIFSIPKRHDSKSAIIQHWPGHKNHAHIRFYCPEDQPGCRR